jgi:hypothetical protein
MLLQQRDHILFVHALASSRRDRLLPYDTRAARKTHAVFHNFSTKCAKRRRFANQAKRRMADEKPRRVSPPQRRKKIRSFSPATCAAEKIPLGLQTCALSVSGGRRVRCSQAAHPFVKKYHFLTGDEIRPACSRS